MATRKSARAQRASLSKRPDERSDTRSDLLEAAGHVFAEQGFDRATGKEICARAGANGAAINYYFGGMERLHAAVLEEANRRILSLEALSAALAGLTDPREQLRIVIELAVDKLTSPVSSAWAFAVLGREIVAPSAAMEALRDTQAAPKARIIRSIVGRLMELDEDHPAVARACLNIVAPMLMLVVADRGTLKRVLPALGLTRADAPALARHMFAYAMAGIAATAQSVKEEAESRRECRGARRRKAT
jgi:AcrR family transcriptional regulator